MNSPFTFRKKTDDELRKAKEKDNEIKRLTEEAAAALQHCLQSDSFAKYREELEKADRDLIRAGIAILRDINDNDKRLALYDRLFARAELLGLLLEKMNEEVEKQK